MSEPAGGISNTNIDHHYPMRMDSCGRDAGGHERILSAIHNGDSAILQNNAANTSALMKDIGDAACTILQNEGATTASIIAANERIAFSTKDTIEKQAMSNRDAIERTGIAGTSTTERTALANMTATESNGRSLGIAIERSAGEIKHINQQIANETRGLLYSHNTQSLLSTKDILLEINKNACKSDKLALENYANIQLEACKNKASLELEALKNKEALAAQIAECCCELKSAVLTTASATQALVKDVESNRVRDALNASTTENLILRLSGNGNGNGNGK